MKLKFYSNTCLNRRLLMGLCQLVMLFAIPCISYAESIDSPVILTRQVSVSFNNGKMGEALAVLENRADVKFVYSTDIIKTDRVVSIEANNETLRTARKSTRLNSSP